MSDVALQPKDMRLELGNHPIAQQLKRLPLGRPAACEYIPQTRAILTPVLETFAA